MSGHLWESVGQVYDLAQPMRPGMPVSPSHPPFQLALGRRHGDVLRPAGGSAANEIIVTGGHVGTHIDALCHVSQDGKLFGGVDASSVQGAHGFSALGIDTVTPIVCHGILLDVAAQQGRDALAPGYEITAGDLEAAEDAAGVRVTAGDAVLIHSGWSARWSDPAAFLSAQSGVPGPGEAAARWLFGRGVRVTGGETIAYEAIYAGVGHRELPVHRILLVEAGIHIIEMLNLAELARDRVAEFLFVAAPLPIQGATGSPLRPLAIV